VHAALRRSHGGRHAPHAAPNDPEKRRRRARVRIVAPDVEMVGLLRAGRTR
jgi:hypothetical protein